jgi:Ca-activated chloride channel family protein
VPDPQCLIPQPRTISEKVKHEDELIDALLKEQARNRQADEALLADIEKAIDAGGTTARAPSKWRAALPLSAAAAIALGGGWWYQQQRKEAPILAYHADATVEKSLEAPPLAAESRKVEQAERRMFAPPAAPAAPVTPAEPTSDMDSLLEAAPAGEAIASNEPNLRLKRAEEVPLVGQITPAPRPAPLRGAGGGALPMEQAPPPARENYGPLVDQPWKSPWRDPLSTFSVDVDTASYTNIRRMIREGREIQPDAVRIEELINYFDYAYTPPTGENAFAAHTLLATCPWQPRHLLARVAIKGREIDNKARPASNLVFLIDVSGSMQSPDKLPMLKQAMRTLVESLDERDHVGIVVYAGSEGVVLDPTRLDERGKSAAIAALEKLEAGGSTNGGAGLMRAYQMATAHMADGGVNRVILATDGDFNVGTTGQGQLVDLVKERAAQGVSLSVVGFGTGNLNDAMLEAITNDGNGNYFYIDDNGEAERIFMKKLTGTLVTIAKDVKIQIEFNPGKVKAYRLIGYSNRVLRDEDFNNDKVDAGDIGAGHTVTAFYEIVPVGVEGPATGDVDPLRYQRPADAPEAVASDDWFTLKLRYKHPEGDISKLIEAPVEGEPQRWEEAGGDFRMATAVALFGMKLRQQEEATESSWDRVIEIARPALAEDPEERRAEFIELVKVLAGR